MAGYLDQYGAGDAKREKTRIRLILLIVAVIAVGGLAYTKLKNFRQERQVKRFGELLQKQDYQGAYQLWGCTEAKPCRDYPFGKFMEDWGPNSSHRGASDFKVSRSRSCGTGVIVTAQFGNTGEERLWVERKDLIIGFSPWPVCPH